MANLNSKLREIDRQRRAQEKRAKKQARRDAKRQQKSPVTELQQGLDVKQ